MSIFEYNEEIEMKKIREDEYNLGKAEGETIGKKIGRNTGIEEVINVMIETYRELGFSKEDTILKISEKFSIPSPKASEYVTRFWK